MVFVLLSQVTEKGAATIKGRPERVKEVNREIEAFGVQVLHQYAVLGPYDFVTVRGGSGPGIRGQDVGGARGPGDGEDPKPPRHPHRRFPRQV